MSVRLGYQHQNALKTAQDPQSSRVRLLFEATWRLWIVFTEHFAISCLLHQANLGICLFRLASRLIKAQSENWGYPENSIVSYFHRSHRMGWIKPFHQVQTVPNHASAIQMLFPTNLSLDQLDSPDHYLYPSTVLQNRKNNIKYLISRTRTKLYFLFILNHEITYSAINLNSHFQFSNLHLYFVICFHIAPKATVLGMLYLI